MEIIVVIGWFYLNNNCGYRIGNIYTFIIITIIIITNHNRPSFFIWDITTFIYIKVFLPIHDGVIDRARCSSNCVINQVIHWSKIKATTTTTTINEWVETSKHKLKTPVSGAGHITKIIIVKQISKTYKYVPGSAQIKFELKKTLFLLLC